LKLKQKPSLFVSKKKLIDLRVKGLLKKKEKPRRKE
jgi:hypothetical protein